MPLHAELITAFECPSTNAERVTVAIEYLLPPNEQGEALLALGSMPDPEAFLKPRIAFLKAALKRRKDEEGKALLRAWVKLAQQQGVAP
jgi:hypothetical protein